MGWFWDEYQENIREYRRTWKRRLLRRLVAILLVILITPVAILVRHVTGSNAAGAIVGVPLLVFAVFFWWWIEDRLYADADARYYADLEAREMGQDQPSTPADYATPIQAMVVDEDATIYPPARPPSMMQPAYQQPMPIPRQPQPKSSGSGWAIAAGAVVLSVLLLCSGLVGGGMLLIARSSHAERNARQQGNDRLADVRQRHEERMREFERRHQEMLERMERDRERMRRPGW